MKSDKDKNRPMSLAEFRKMRHTLLPENRKIKNARKVERDGIRFDSRLELFMYDLLKMAGIRRSATPCNRGSGTMGPPSGRSPTLSIFGCRITTSSLTPRATTPSRET